MMLRPMRVNNMIATGTATATKMVPDVISGSKVNTPKMNNAPPMVMKMVDTTHIPTSKSIPMHPDAAPRFSGLSFLFRFLIPIAAWKNSRADREIHTPRFS